VSIQNAAIDVLINSAGIFGKPNQKVGKVDYPAWANVLHANTMGPLRVTEEFVDHIARSERRLVVTISSGMGSLADSTSGGSIPYRSSKAAVNMLRHDRRRPGFARSAKFLRKIPANFTPFF
jgi:NAD(P)-dependent dehydrogenase (short-subunit alcohol dehydrogenase family)